MTGRTHDLAGFTALSFVVATQGTPDMTFATALTAISANMIGALAPDIDQSTANLWRRVRGGSALGKLLAPLLGGHRMISHSIIGVVLFGVLVKLFLNVLGTVLLVDMNIVWWAFMIGFVSHLIADSITREGVPWLFPIPINFGFPPFRFMRFKTGGFWEKSIIFPLLLVANIAIYYLYYDQFIALIKNYLN